MAVECAIGRRRTSQRPMGAIRTRGSGRDFAGHVPYGLSQPSSRCVIVGVGPGGRRDPARGVRDAAPASISGAAAHAPRASSRGCATPRPARVAGAARRSGRVPGTRARRRPNARRRTREPSPAPARTPAAAVRAAHDATHVRDRCPGRDRGRPVRGEGASRPFVDAGVTEVYLHSSRTRTESAVKALTEYRATLRITERSRVRGLCGKRQTGTGPQDPMDKPEKRQHEKGLEPLYEALQASA